MDRDAEWSKTMEILTDGLHLTRRVAEYHYSINVIAFNSVTRDFWIRSSNIPAVGLFRAALSRD